VVCQDGFNLEVLAVGYLGFKLLVIHKVALGVDVALGAFIADTYHQVGVCRGIELPFEGLTEVILALLNIGGNLGLSHVLVAATLGGVIGADGDVAGFHIGERV
jgi:hypothetical protein